jgi:hypothetical protein
MSIFNSAWVLRVMKVFPQPQVTFVTTYFGWIFSFIARPRASRSNSQTRQFNIVGPGPQAG